MLTNMAATVATAERGEPTSQASAPPAPRSGSVRDFLPYLRDHRGTLVAITVISLGATGLVLVQPLLVQSLVDRVGSGAR